MNTVTEAYRNSTLGAKALQATCKALVPLALLAAAVTANAQILGVTASSVTGTFTSQNGNFALVSNPLSFTYPVPAVFAANDGAGTAAFTALIGGFVIANRGNVNSTFILVPQTSYLLQGPGALGLATLTLNYSINYAVGARGVAGGFQNAFYQIFGTIGAAPGSFASLTASAVYTKVGGPGLGAIGLNSGILTRASAQVNPFNGAFNFPLTNRQFINGFAGAGVMNISGQIQWSGDPSSIEIGAEAIPTPEPAPFCVFGIGLVALLKRRKARRSS